MATGMKAMTATVLAQLFGGLSPCGSVFARGKAGDRRTEETLFALQPPDQNGLRLPAGFTSRIVAVSGERVLGSAYEWHKYPDGGACFPTSDGGWIYTSNCEAGGWWRGGAGAIRFDREGNISDAYPILSLTTRNCAGGATPWGTWLSAEEMKSGRVWECDVEGNNQSRACKGLGTFRHEACAVDPKTLQIYMTEDEQDGHLYRFTPTDFSANGQPRLDCGRLEAAIVDADSGKVDWQQVPDPNPHTVATWGGTPVRYQTPNATNFGGGEGIAYFDNAIIFVTKGDGKVRMLNLSTNTLITLYEPAKGRTPAGAPFDSMTISPLGQILLSEDSGPVRIRMMTHTRKVPFPTIEALGHAGSEATGLAFSADMTRLYFSSQRGDRNGAVGKGITYEVTGPFKEL